MNLTYSFKLIAFRNDNERLRERWEKGIDSNGYRIALKAHGNKFIR